MLPNAESNIWNELPVITEAFSCPESDSFSQTLVQAKNEAKQTVNIPVLISKRYGKGIILAVNSPGLWKWDFFPLNGETAEFYKNFWTQLVFWTVSYSDFMPDKNYAVKLSKNNAAPNEKIYITVNSKTKSQKQPEITILKNGQIIKKIIPAQVQPKLWNALCSFTEPGIYKIALMNKEKHIDIFAPLKVTAPPDEYTNTSADPVHFSEMLNAAGGKLMTLQETEQILKSNDEKISSVKKNQEWVSVWDKWYLLLIILLFSASECYLRRKNGLL
jgi:hypothetical protein